MPTGPMKNRLPAPQSLKTRFKHLIRDGHQHLDMGGVDATTETKRYTGSPIAGKALDIDARNDKE